MSLYVGNLHPDITEAILFNHFSSFGSLVDIRLCRDSVSGSSLGYAYVNFTTSEDATAAMEMLNYEHFGGQPLRIMWAQKDARKKFMKSANLVIKNLPKTMNDKDLRDTFASFGSVLAVKVATHPDGEPKGYGFVQFESEKSAEDATSSMNGTLLQNKTIQISKFIPYEERKKFQEVKFANNVHVKNLSTTITNQELEDLCNSFGTVVSAKISTNGDGKSRGYGFVNFESEECANKAVVGLNEMCLDGRCLEAQVAFKKSFVKTEEIPVKLPQPV